MQSLPLCSTFPNRNQCQFVLLLEPVAIFSDPRSVHCSLPLGQKHHYRTELCLYRFSNCGLQKILGKGPLAAPEDSTTAAFPGPFRFFFHGPISKDPRKKNLKGLASIMVALSGTSFKVPLESVCGRRNGKCWQKHHRSCARVWEGRFATVAAPAARQVPLHPFQNELCNFVIWRIRY